MRAPRAAAAGGRHPASLAICASAAGLLALATGALAQQLPTGAAAQEQAGASGAAAPMGSEGHAVGAAAQETAGATGLPQSGAPSPEIASPRDIPYPGLIQLAVDATDADHAIFAVHETVPVRGGEHLVMLYPRWLPGNHSPTGPIDKLAGLIVHAGGQRLEWRRDPTDVYAFHIDVPAGASTIELDFQYLSPVSDREGRVEVTPDMLNLKWNAVALYPAGYYSRRVTVQPSVRLPQGFTLASALETASVSGAVTTFKAVTFNNLVDSPLIAGRYFKYFELDPGGPAPVRLDVIADRPEQLAATPVQVEAHRRLVQQAYRLFGSHHYSHYDFLLWLSDKMGGEGLEHHQSSEDGTIPKYFTDWEATPAGRDLLAHEFTHSWNGKFRRGADLWTPSFNVPMRDSLLWVYEGQTQYWGYVLSARSGLLSKQQALDAIALTAATYDHRVGRAWRAMIDTTNDPIISSRRPLSWLSWQRSEDYYSEGQLIWMDVDTLIRERSRGRKSLDDFARAFFGMDNGSFVTRTYDFDEVVRTLNRVEPYDWATFLHTRLEGHGPGAPLDGLGRGGYRLVYTDKPTDYAKSAEEHRKVTDLSFSIGMVVGKEGVVSDVMWDSPAFKAGLTEGVQIVAVNGDAYSSGGLKDAIKAAHAPPVPGATNAGASPSPIELLIKAKDRFRTVRIDYRDGLRYPRLERLSGAPARLDDILEPRK